MYSLDFLYYSLGVGFLILIGFMCYVLYYLAQDLKSVRDILEQVEDVTRGIDLIGTQLKLSVLNFTKRLLMKGGEEKNGKRKKR